MTTFERTKDFHSVFGHPVRDTPQTISRKEAILTLALIEEEYGELVDAMFPNLREDARYTNLTPVEYLQSEEECYDEDVACRIVDEDWYQDTRTPYAPDLVAIADATADLDVVINGCGIRHGLPMEALSREVAKSNHSKLDEDGKPVYKPNGKIGKSDLFREPDIAGVLGL